MEALVLIELRGRLAVPGSALGASTALVMVSDTMDPLDCANDRHGAKGR
jgi:hypothetical protein